MPISSLILRSGLASLACLSLIANPAHASYVLEDNFSGANFFDNFDFFTGQDPTNGFVKYVDQPTAQKAGLLSSGAGAAASWGVDSTSYLNSTGAGRMSVRLSSKKAYTHALIVSDIAHMPGAICGTWPAHWTLGPNWPSSGEIDIIEGVNNAAYNLMSLHTSPGCTIAGANQTGTLQTNNCDTSLNWNSGCGTTSTTSSSYGDGFNAGLGGVYATQWTSDFIRIWYFPRGAIPADITAGTPDPTLWGLPAANMQGSCTIDSQFANHQILFDTTFCGDYGNADWSKNSYCQAQSGAETCSQYVASSPSAFTNAFWSVNSIRVYQDNSPPATTSAGSPASTSVASLSSVTPASSVFAPGMGVSSSSATTRGSNATMTNPATSVSTPYGAATASAALAGATNPASIGAFSYLGCASSGSGFSSFIQVDNRATMSLDICLAECSAYGYAGVFNTLCYCGNSLGSSTVVTPGQGQCDNPCPGNLLQLCGGSILPSKKMIRQASNNVLLSLYQNRAAASAALVSVVPANQVFGYGMGGGATAVTTIVASTNYVNVCNACAGGYTTVGYTTIIEKCGCAANEATLFGAMSASPTVPMTAVETICSACGPNGSSATVTVTIPCALADASAYKALPTITVTSAPAGQVGQASTYTANDSTYTAIVAAPSVLNAGVVSTISSGTVTYTTTIYAATALPNYTAAAGGSGSGSGDAAHASVAVPSVNRVQGAINGTGAARVAPSSTGLAVFTGGAERLVGSLGGLSAALLGLYLL